MQAYIYLTLLIAFLFLLDFPPSYIKQNYYKPPGWTSCGHRSVSSQYNTPNETLQKPITLGSGNVLERAFKKTISKAPLPKTSKT